MLQRNDFINRFAAKGYTKKDSEVILDDFLSTLEEALVSGENVMFRGFGTFEVRDRAARESLSPTTGERVPVPAYRTVHFSIGKLLKREMKTGVIEKDTPDKKK